jgi:hypothetical protein
VYVDAVLAFCHPDRLPLTDLAAERSYYCRSLRCFTELVAPYLASAVYDVLFARMLCVLLNAVTKLRVRKANEKGSMEQSPV